FSATESEPLDNPPLRLLVVDDDSAVHRDLDRALAGTGCVRGATLSSDAVCPSSNTLLRGVQVDHVYSQAEAWDRIREAKTAGRPYGLTFVGMPGPVDSQSLGVVERLWELAPDLYVVLCASRLDDSSTQVELRLSQPDRWLLMRKPVDVIELRQLVTVLAQWWKTERELQSETTRLRQSASVATQVARREIEQREQSERQLQEQEDRIRQLQRLDAMGVVTGQVAHEFNNLLQVIQSYVSFPLEILPPATSVAADLQTALRAVRRATELTGKLLKFGRRKRLRRHPISLNQLVRSFVKTWEPLLGTHIEIRTSLEAVPATVDADPDLLEQVLTNLCLNARDAMPEGGWIEIATRHSGHTEDGSPRTVELRMTDTGTGMDDATCRRIFDPFFTTKGVGKGTGLGLAVAYGIIQEHEGEIDVESEPGVGTTFRIQLPLVAQPEGPCHRPARHATVPTRELQGFGEKILIAEDEPTIRDVLVRIFESRGFAPVAAANGHEAWELFDRYRSTWDLVILDERMPGQNGLDVVAKIRQVAPHTPILLCTGYDMRAEEDEWLRIVAKPFETRDLLEAAAYFLEKPHLAGT
ncbi:MAG TPA: response regulator, partial [Planctomycetaceae bacterium]|nr:response regulator [Planctomycetaceae bacterium]